MDADSPHEQRCKVVVVDDHAMVRESISAALDLDDMIDVVGAAATIAAASSLVADTEPDVVVIDYALPDGTGVELARNLHATHADLPTIILTANEEARTVAEAVAAGCAGFIGKSADLRQLTRGVRRVQAGESLFDPAELSQAMRWLHRRPSPTVELTERETEVLALLATGRSTVEISEDLVLSHHTVRNHVRNLLHKLGAHSQLEAVVIASDMGLVQVGQASA